jgi:AcrR family transcriptional regulator
MATARPRLSRAEQQARTRSDLVEAAGRLFAQRGFAGTSVEAIAADAGYTRGAFYSNFSSKEELFAELLQQRVFATYRAMALESADPSRRPTAREVGEQAGALQGNPDTHWLFVLWLELLAHAGRDGDFRRIAAEFWRGTRALGAAAITAAYEEAGRTPPTDPERLASAFIALDVGLAVQHWVDPEGAPLDLYPELFELLLEPLDPAAGR